MLALRAFHQSRCGASSFDRRVQMRTITIIKRSIGVNGTRTSVSLENEFWQSLHEIAKEEGRSTTELVEQINRERRNPNLSSAIRVFVLNRFRASGGHAKTLSPEAKHTTQLP
jgi:predicted DNA-binding ribbon-helix-helix protein